MKSTIVPGTRLLRKYDFELRSFKNFSKVEDQIVLVVKEKRIRSIEKAEADELIKKYGTAWLENQINQKQLTFSVPKEAYRIFNEKKFKELLSIEIDIYNLIEQHKSIFDTLEKVK